MSERSLRLLSVAGAVYFGTFGVVVTRWRSIEFVWRMLIGYDLLILSAVLLWNAAEPWKVSLRDRTPLAVRKTLSQVLLRLLHVFAAISTGVITLAIMTVLLGFMSQSPESMGTAMLAVRLLVAFGTMAVAVALVFLRLTPKE